MSHKIQNCCFFYTLHNVKDRLPRFLSPETRADLFVLLCYFFSACSFFDSLAVLIRGRRVSRATEKNTLFKACIPISRGQFDLCTLQNGCKDIKLILYMQISIPQIRHSNDLSPHFRQFVAYRKGEFWGSRKDARKMHGVFGCRMASDIMDDVYWSKPIFLRGVRLSPPHLEVTFWHLKVCYRHYVFFPWHYLICVFYAYFLGFLFSLYPCLYAGEG